ncbi:MAG: acetyl-CoA carboxylase biotin carboxylase subunit [Chloroflexota bacterium]
MQKILIANRGEIAVRIIRTAQALGYETVAVFSDADAAAPHVALADKAVRLGAAEVGASYLNIERILAAAQRTGADAVHPGYGFLSENPDFALQAIAKGLTWIGPPPQAMEVMGNKAAAKDAIAKHSVPTVPGYSGSDQSDVAFAAAAEQIGYPLMVKAAAGGGGRGMRLVAQSEELAAALASARSESLKAFGSNELLLEKAIVNPRHIEVQVFGDMHGNVIHLGERDCSIQRRHQKVVEEAPSPAVSAELREAMGKAAVSAAKAVGYYGAGTVEFLLDESGDFYFIEMNTRLQVEHPVTEMIAEQDLVAWQLLVAEGEPLPLTQKQVQLSGHSIEVRLYAEDPDNQFLPSTGDIHLWQPPTGEGVRVDHGLASGLAITPYYDAMVAKVITWGETRAIAQRRLVKALKQTAVFGVTTNRRFLLETAVHPTFVAGEATTQFIADTWQPATEKTASPELEALAGLLFYLRDGAGELGGWQSRPFSVCLEGRLVVVTTHAASNYQVEIEEQTFQIGVLEQTANSLRFEQDGLRDSLVYAFEADGCLWLQLGWETAVFTDTLLAPPASADATSSGNVTAPMPGAVMRIDVAIGDAVSKGETLLILEAMKMEHAIPAPFDGTVSEIHVAQGQQMQPRALMIVVTPTDS